MDQCISAASMLLEKGVLSVDITGGAPELHPDYRYLISSLSDIGCKIMTRTNLAVLVKAGYEDLPGFFAENRVEVIGSLPCYTKENTDKVRGQGVFDASIEAMRRLNELGYGEPKAGIGTGLALNLVYNPSGAFMPPAQAELEGVYKSQLLDNFGVRFNNLYTITNMPIGRFSKFLQSTDSCDSYLVTLVSSFNPEAAKNVMCRTQINVGPDGVLYDCDFNRVAGLGLSAGRTHIKDFSGLQRVLATREIATASYCFGCTAGAGSSCCGVVV